MSRQGSGGSRRSPLTYRGTSTCAELLQQAEVVFCERGYYGASVAEICRRAGVAQGTFYQYFENKEDVFLKLVERLEQALRTELEGVLAAPGSVQERLLAGFRTLLSSVENHVELYRVFREAEFVRWEIPRRFYSAIAGMISQALEAGIAHGEFRPLDPEVVAHAFVGIVDFLSMNYILWEPGSLDEQVLWAAEELILHGIDTGREAAPSQREPLRAPTPEGEAEPRGGEATRRALLAAAERLFGQAGFHGTTISEITYVAGVAQGTFYLYFPSKVALFTELVREINRQLRAAERAAITGLRDRREVERAGFKAYFNFISRRWEAYRILREAESVDARVGRWYYQSLARNYTRALREGMERGEIRLLPPEPLAYALFGIGHFAGLRWIVWEEGSQVSERIFTELMSFIMRGISAS